MNVGFSSFAHSFQSVQASGSQTTNKVATASTATSNVGIRTDVLSIGGQHVMSGTYQRPTPIPGGIYYFPEGTVGATTVQDVNGNVIQTTYITQEEQATILEKFQSAQLQLQKEAENLAANPRVTTYSTYFGDTLVSVTTLGEFFGKQMGIKNPFEIVFGKDGLLSLNGNVLLSVESEAIKQVLADINRYLVAEEAGEDTEGMLSPVLTGIAEKFASLKEVMGKLHDKSLIPKEVRFGVNG